MADTIKQFAQLYASLIQEKKDLEDRLEEINKALSGEVKSNRRGRPKKTKKKSTGKRGRPKKSAAKKPGRPKKGAEKRGRSKKKAAVKKTTGKRGRPKKAVAKKAPAKKKGGKRAKNKTSLREAITAALGKKHLTKEEILKAVLASGYKFSAKDPMNSLQVQLYTKFKKDKDKKFHV